MRLKVLVVLCGAAVLVGVARADTVFSETFESGTLGQFQSVGSGAGTGWTASSADAHGGTYSAFALDVAATSDHSLISAPVAMPATDPLTLHFWHRFNLETILSQACDGGVLEISVDGGPFVDVLNWGSFLHGGYNQTMDPNCVISGNPLGVRPVWSGNSGEWLQVVVALANELHGKSVRFAFRLGTDGTVGDEGWYVDDVYLERESPTAVTVASFSASAEGSSIKLAWRTGSEAQTLGFNLYRQQRGKLAKANRTLIPSVFGGTTRGHGYSFLDRSAPSGRRTLRYRLQAVALDGTRSWIGSATVAHSRRPFG